ncbi:hypothetical protein BJV77DRAFT_961065 [Russula vinacea]|nr:hypothetical protein BJV77DRAFT_961065 [Russula vinacea]
MRTFNFGLLAVLSCISMIGATPIGNDAPAGLPPPIPCITTEPEPLPYGCDPSLTFGGGDAIGRRQLPIPCITTDPQPFPNGCDPSFTFEAITVAMRERQCVEQGTSDFIGYYISGVHCSRFHSRTEKEKLKEVRIEWGRILWHSFNYGPGPWTFLADHEETFHRCSTRRRQKHAACVAWHYGQEVSVGQPTKAQFCISTREEAINEWHRIQSPNCKLRISSPPYSRSNSWLGILRRVPTQLQAALSYQKKISWIKEGTRISTRRSRSRRSTIKGGGRKTKDPLRAYFECDVMVSEQLPLSVLWLVMTEKSLSEMEGYLRPTLQMGRWAFLEVFASSMGILKFGKLATGG